LSWSTINAVSAAGDGTLVASQQPKHIAD